MIIHISLSFFEIIALVQKGSSCPSLRAVAYSAQSIRRVLPLANDKHWAEKRIKLWRRINVGIVSALGS